MLTNKKYSYFSFHRVSYSFSLIYFFEKGFGYVSGWRSANLCKNNLCVGVAVATEFYPRTVSVNSHLPHTLHRM